MLREIIFLISTFFYVIEDGKTIFDDPLWCRKSDFPPQGDVLNFLAGQKKNIREKKFFFFLKTHQMWVFFIGKYGEKNWGKKVFLKKKFFFLPKKCELGGFFIGE